MGEVRRLLHHHATDDAAAREEATAPAATATPGLTERQHRLLDAIRTHRGEWTTRRVLHLFALTDPGIVQRGTARRDLATLHRAGHLVLVDDPDNRHYALHTQKGGDR
jgi:Fe2+ or Zn2+ uptake regulation protein